MHQSSTTTSAATTAGSRARLAALQSRHALYSGKHRPVAAEGQAPAPVRSRRARLSRALRRPVLVSAVALGVVAATAAGYANAQVGAFPAAPTAAQAGPSSQQLLVADISDRVQNATARREADAAEKARKAAAAKAAALVKARKEAAARAARDKARKAVLAKARSNPRAVGRLLAAQHGWTGSQFSCLESLWTKESGWKHTADNPTSSAYGIPQALPGSKMASAGSDWATNPATQIKWGLGYIKDRYGSPCAAWSHSKAVNWY